MTLLVYYECHLNIEGHDNSPTQYVFKLYELEDDLDMDSDYQTDENHADDGESTLNGSSKSQEDKEGVEVLKADLANVKTKLEAITTGLFDH